MASSEYATTQKDAEDKLLRVHTIISTKNLNHPQPAAVDRISNDSVIGGAQAENNEKSIQNNSSSLGGGDGGRHRYTKVSLQPIHKKLQSNENDISMRHIAKNDSGHWPPTAQKERIAPRTRLTGNNLNVLALPPGVDPFTDKLPQQQFSSGINGGVHASSQLINLNGVYRNGGIQYSLTPQGGAIIDENFTMHKIIDEQNPFGLQASQSSQLFHKMTTKQKDIIAEFNLSELSEQEPQPNIFQPRSIWQKLRLMGMRTLESYPSVIFMSFVTLYTLFLDDLRVLLIDKQKDSVFYVITSVCFFLFLIEIIVGSLCRQPYFMTFFFWLDFVSTLSMLPDIGWFWDLVTGEGTNINATNATQLAKTSRAGRVTRIIRVIRLIRLIRIVKLYKQAKLAQKKNEDNERRQLHKQNILKKMNQPMRSDRKFTARNQAQKINSNLIKSEVSQAVVAIMPSPNNTNLNGDFNGEEQKGSIPSSMYKTPNNPRWLAENGFQGYTGLSNSANVRQSPTIVKYPPLPVITEQKDELMIDETKVVDLLQPKNPFNPIVNTAIIRYQSSNTQGVRNQLFYSSKGPQDIQEIDDSNESNKLTAQFRHLNAQTNLNYIPAESNLAIQQPRTSTQVQEQGSSQNNVFQESNEKNENMDYNSSLSIQRGQQQQDGQEIFTETQISKLLSERITKIVIIIVLIMLFSQPLFQIKTFYELPAASDSGLSYMRDVYNTNGSWNEFQTIANQIIGILATNQNYPIILLQIPDIGKDFRNNYTYTWQQPPSLETLRSDEFLTSISIADDGFNFVAYYSNKSSAKLNALLNIIRTLFVCVVLSMASQMFINDANTLVLNPIERMLEKVRLIQKNPLAAASDEVQSAGVLSVLAQQEGDQPSSNTKSDQKTSAQKVIAKQESANEAQYETEVIEKALIKIGHLLALGFGEAGSKIIGTNIGASGDIDPLLAGQKVQAIFGFCDIRNFTDSTEVLQTSVMLFVNQIAEITHSVVDKYGGSANKNIGDAFLLVWKFKDQDEFFTEECLKGINYETQKFSLRNQQMADLALFSFLKIIAKINKFTHILNYQRNEELQKRMPGYKVRMGFGLHQGWAIEGAIGSVHKIDASYLSPNVNMAARLEAATKQYGVSLLLSDSMHALFTDEIKLLCRQIDRATVKGSIVPLALYTVDIDTEHIKEKKDAMHAFSHNERKKIRDKEKKVVIEKITSGKQTTWDLFEKDKDFKALRQTFDRHFAKKFGQAYNSYIKGDWATAEDMLSQCLKIKPKDGPSLTLKSYIEELNGAAPQSWQGFRELTEK